MNRQLKSEQMAREASEKKNLEYQRAIRDLTTRLGVDDNYIRTRPRVDYDRFFGVAQAIQSEEYFAYDLLIEDLEYARKNEGAKKRLTPKKHNKAGRQAKEGASPKEEK